ncbi:MAG: transporter substrate-binding domain-containing protein [Bacteroidales bacterium]|nr:transporter substrate-binding domain-containing protein [Bacteroidales bacterium]
MRKFVFLLLFVLVFASCENKEKDSEVFCLQKQYEELLSSGVLRVTLNYNSIDYYIYKGKPLGFQLELLNELAHYLGLHLQVVVHDNTAQVFESLIVGKSDILAGNNKETHLRNQFLLFSEPHSKSPLALVQRKTKDRFFVSQWSDLQGKTIALPANSSYSEFIYRNSVKQNVDFNFLFDKENSIENLIEMVSNKSIDYTVCERNVAKVYASYYDNIDYSFEVCDSLSLEWVFHPKNIALRDTVNVWLEGFKQTKKYKKLYHKYYHYSYSPVRFSNSMESKKQNQLSKYDKVLKKVSQKYKWDWRLYGAIIYQESKFKDGLIGEGGSFGLLQLMPATAKKFGVTPSMNGEQQITHGAKLIDYLRNKYKDEVVDQEQLGKFVIAAYHTGSGHIDEARRIAVKFGKDPNIWDSNVDSCLILKAKPSIYNLPEVKSGYHYGKRSKKYVNDVWNRYLHYKNIYPEY